MAKQAMQSIDNRRERARRYVADQRKAEWEERVFLRGWHMSFRDRKEREAVNKFAGLKNE